MERGEMELSSISEQGILDRLPDELLLSFMRFLDTESLVKVSQMCKSLGRTGQEILFHTIELNTKHEYGDAFLQCRQLIRTLLHRKDLRGKVKKLTTYLHNDANAAGRKDPLTSAEVTALLSVTDSLAWTTYGCPYGKCENFFRDKMGGDVGALFFLLPSLEVLKMNSHHNLTTYNSLFGSFMVPLITLPAFQKLQSLTIYRTFHRLYPFFEIGHPLSLLTLPNLTRLDLGCVTVETFMHLIDKPVTPTYLSGIKHLSLEHAGMDQLDTDHLLGSLLRCLRPLESFAWIDYHWDGVLSVAYTTLLQQLASSYHSLQKLTIIGPIWYDGDILAYPITTLRSFTQLRFLRIDQHALVGSPITRMNQAEFGTVIGHGGLVEKLPISLETLVVNCKGKDAVELCDEMLALKNTAMAICNGEVEHRPEEGVEQDEKLNELKFHELDTHETEIQRLKQGQQEGYDGAIFPLTNLHKVTINVDLKGEFETTMLTSMADRWRKAGWELNEVLFIEDEHPT
ncbi:hypothetical protein BU16DRAFT_561725 [Lophium mytilinum]|uniref:F-box domain-containing protein n=1 Tax=Lophium mytilinum TaxID=390894 RepID=A0A6A6QTI5_9PEZI|nr:hypothetical protein BU16DRAFT_561725 [Lophium mytilinum]